MTQGLIRLEDAENEPIDSDFVLKYHRALADDEDVIEMLIPAARREAERATNRAFLEQQWQLTLDDFPRAGVADPLRTGILDPYTAGGYIPFDLASADVAAKLATRFAIRIPKPPLMSVLSVVYRNADGLPTALDSSAYIVDKTSLPGRIVPVVGATWPATQPGPGAVTIIYLAGYSDDPEEIPEEIRIAIALGVGTLFRNREGQTMGISIVDNPMVSRLLADHVFQQMD